MQLGELQANLARFERRNTTVVAISVDELEESKRLASERKWAISLLSDPGLSVIRSFGLENPDVEELALHAVYITQSDGTILYRKVARRRPYSQELLDAIDHHQGAPSTPDEALPEDVRQSIPFLVSRVEALVAVAGAKRPPAGLETEAKDLLPISADLASARWDPAVVAWREFAERNRDRPRTDLTALGRYLVYTAFLAKSTHVRAMASELAQLNHDEQRSAGVDMLKSLSGSDTALVGELKVAVGLFDEIARMGAA